MEENKDAMTGSGSAGAVNSEMGEGNLSGQEKTYTQAEFDKALLSESDKRVNQALENAKKEWQADFEKKLKTEKDEAARLAKMTADERAKAEFDKRVKEFEDREKAYNSERLMFECGKQLAEKGMPISFAKLLTGDNAEQTKSNIEKFSEEYSKAIQEAVEKRVKGKTPETGAGGMGDTVLESLKKGAGLIR